MNATPSKSGDRGTILVVEDDKALREGLALSLRSRGFTVLLSADGEDGMRQAFDNHPDLVVLDIMLPGFNGLEILSELREKGQDVPVLILSARGKTPEKIEGLSLGADDYLAKPFDLGELLARVEALLRRGQARKKPQEALAFGDITVDIGARRVTRSGKVVDLSAKEFDLLCLLARSPGQAFSRETILDRVWGWGFEGTTRTVDNFILGLRQKLEDDPTQPRHIKTVRQVGYKMEP